MDLRLLEIVRCPFCGSRLKVEEDPSLEGSGDELSTGILCCQCCAYPVVSGIPYLCDDPSAEEAMRQLEKGVREEALFTLLDLEKAEQREFKRLSKDGRSLTFQKALGPLNLDAESAYFLYRFSDPTFLCSQAVLRAVGRDRRCFARRALDLCCGPGHLTRTLCALAGGGEVVMANISFRELWLARHFIAPSCQPICCDANKPLPFARETFSLAFCSDAFHYIWSKRLLADEMARLVGDSGVIVLAHLHSSLGENYSAGMPLAPADYRNFFEGAGPRLYKESMVLDAVVQCQLLELSAGPADAELAGESALVLIATRLKKFFPVCRPPYGPQRSGTLAVNPLYRLERRGRTTLLELRFPSAEYEEEFGGCKRYLPERVELAEDVLERSWAGKRDTEVRELAERYVLLDLPPSYI